MLLKSKWLSDAKCAATNQPFQPLVTAAVRTALRSLTTASWRVLSPPCSCLQEFSKTKAQWINSMGSRLTFLQSFSVSIKNVYSSSHVWICWVPNWVLPFSCITSPPVCKLWGPYSFCYTCLFKFPWSLARSAHLCRCCLANNIIYDAQKETEFSFLCPNR